MPNAVKYTLTAPTGSIQKGVVSIGVNGGTGPTGTTGWYNGITPTTGTYIIFETNGSYAPRIYAPQNSDELKRIALQLGASSGNIVSEAAILSWFATQNNYSIINKSYPNIVTDNLVYLIDSTFTPSYPTTGTTAYPVRDIAGVGNGTLQNGVGFDTNTGAFIFDGSDDQIPLALSDNFQNIDWSNGITIMALYKIDAVTDFNSQFRALMGSIGTRSWNFYLYGPTTPATQLYYHFSANYRSGLSDLITITTGSYHLGALTCSPASSTYYHDGVAVGTQTPATPAYYTAGGTQYLGRADNMWKGNIAKWMIYNRALTQAEILQNYYQGNIVTSGLVFALDAGNLASYPGSGNNWYDISGNNNNGTLVNGPVFLPNSNGGVLSFDSSDDYATVPYNSNLDLVNDVSLETWVKYTTTSNTVLIEKSNNNSHYQLQIFNSSQGTPGIAGQLVFMLQPNSNNWVVSGMVTNDNNWHHVVGTYNRATSTAMIYVDGVLRNTNSSITTGPTSNTQPLLIGSRSGVAGFGGSIGGIRIYNRALTQAEVQQNYSAQSSRFK